MKNLLKRWFRQLWKFNLIWHLLRDCWKGWTKNYLWTTSGSIQGTTSCRPPWAEISFLSGHRFQDFSASKRRRHQSDTKIHFEFQIRTKVDGQNFSVCEKKKHFVITNLPNCRHFLLLKTTPYNVIDWRGRCRNNK